jgi:hypothetical protein
MDELRGKTLGVSRFGSVTDNLTRMLLRRYNLEGAVQIRQMGGTTEMAAAFQRRQIDGAVMATVRVNAPMRMLVDLAELGIRIERPIAASRDYYRRNPDMPRRWSAPTWKAPQRRPTKGKSAAGHSKCTRPDPKLIQELTWTASNPERVADDAGADADRRVMGKKPIPVKATDNSTSTA